MQGASPLSKLKEPQQNRSHSLLAILLSLLALLTSWLWQLDCQQRLSCLHEKEFSGLGSLGAKRGAFWTECPLKINPLSPSTCLPASLWSCGATASISRRSYGEPVTFPGLWRERNCLVLGKASHLKQRHGCTLQAQGVSFQQIARSYGAINRRRRTFSCAPTFRLWTFKLPALRAGFGGRWSFGSRGTQCHCFGCTHPADRFAISATGVSVVCRGSRKRGASISHRSPGAFHHCRSASCCVGRRCLAAAITIDRRQGPESGFGGFFGRGVQLHHRAGCQRGHSRAHSFRLHGFLFGPRSRQFGGQSTGVGTRWRRCSFGEDPVLLCRRGTRDPSCSSPACNKAKRARSWYHWRRSATIQKETNGCQPGREFGGHHNYTASHHSVPTGAQRERAEAIEAQRPLDRPSALRRPLGASAMPGSSDLSTPAAQLLKEMPRPKSSASNAKSPHVTFSEGEAQEMSLEIPSEPQDLAKAMLVQSQALTTLVSHLTATSSDPFQDLSSASTSLSTKGAVSRAKLQAELAAQKGTFFVSVLQQMARRMQPAVAAEVEMLTLRNRGITPTQYLERFGGFGRCRDIGLITWQVALVLNHMMEDNHQAAKDALSLLFVCLEQTAMDNGNMQVGLLLSLTEDPPQALFTNKSVMSAALPRPFAPTAHQRWVTTALQYLKEMDVISTRRSEVVAAQTGAHRTNNSNSSDQPATTAAPKKKQKGKGGGRGQKGQQTSTPQEEEQ